MMMAEKQERRDAALRAEIKAEMRAELLALLKSGKLIDELKNIDSPKFPSSKDSNNAPDTVVLGDPSPHSPTEEVREDCTLYLDEPIRVVAHAYFYRQATMHHSMPIPDSLSRVSVKNIKGGEEGSGVPIPEPEVLHLGQSKGCFILWPNNLISTPTTPHEVVAILLSYLFFFGIIFIVCILYINRIQKKLRNFHPCHGCGSYEKNLYP